MWEMSYYDQARKMAKFVNGKQGFCRREVGISLVLTTKPIYPTLLDLHRTTAWAKLDDLDIAGCVFPAGSSGILVSVSGAPCG